MRILFITLSNIGDCILTLPVLDCLKNNFPQAEIMVIAGPRPALIFQESRNVHKVFVYDKHARLSVKINLIKFLREVKFDLVVDLRRSIFPWLIPCRRKNSNLSRTFLRGLIPRRKVRDKLFCPSKLKHMRQRHLFKLSGLGLKMENKGIAGKSLFIRPQDDDYVSKILKDAGMMAGERIIVIAPGARSLIKRWPQEKFSGLIDNLPAGFKIVLLGSPEDSAVGKFISRNVKVPVIDLIGRTNLLEAAALLKKASLLITNDSANLHLASYLNVPIVAIFGPTDDAKYGPWSENWRVAKKEIFCRPCRKAQCRFKSLECLRCVGMEDVLRQAQDILGLRAQEIKGKQGIRARKEFKRILIIRTDRVGDVILSTPVIKALRAAYPHAYIAIVVRPYTRAIVEGNPNLDEVIIYDKDSQEKSWGAAFLFSRALARKRFDLAVALNPGNRSNLIPFLAGIPRRIGYSRKLGFLHTDRIKDRKSEGKKHEVEYNLDLVRVLGIEPRDKNTFMPISAESELWVKDIFKKENILSSDKLVVINPAASDNSKIWLAERYAQAADKLAAKGLKIIILGGPQDREITGQVIKNLHCAYVNMVGNNNISQAASLLKRCSLFISSDTGPMHLADSVGIPVIAIWSRAQPGLSPRRWGPRNEKSIVIQKDVGCVECLAHNCSKGFLCLQAITVDDVLFAAQNRGQTSTLETKV